MKEKKYVFLIVLLGVVILLNLPPPVSWRVKSGTRDNMVPFQNVMMLIINKARDGVLFVKKARTVLDNEAKVMEELVMLREKERSMKELKRENEDLRKQIGFSKRSKHKLVCCEVATRGDISGWWHTITLNKGTDEGVKRNMAVITTKGLIGKTIGVSKHTADVLLITDPNCRVACKFSRTGSFGILCGAGVSAKGKSALEMLASVKPCKMSYMSKDDEIWGYDEVVTSGLGGIFPEGLLVGNVTGSSVDSAGLYQRADILPAAELGALKYVFVVVE
ncbi:rod shape-determining protein MreC [Verrucomicrobiota bacterium]